MARQPDRETLADLERTLAVISSAAELCSEFGARFVLARLPAKVQTEPRSFERLLGRLHLASEDYDRRQPGESLLTRARERGIETIDLLPVLEVTRGSNPAYFREGHPNALGNFRAAERLASLWDD